MAPEAATAREATTAQKASIPSEATTGEKVHITNLNARVGLSSALVILLPCQWFVAPCS